MKQFDEAYKNSPTLSPLVGKMSWSYNMIIFSRYKTSEEQEFYLKITKQKGYNKKESEQQLSGSSFKGRAAE